MSTNGASKGSLSRLTATQVAALQPGEKSRDISDPAVPGLVLRVGPGTSKRWLFRFKLKGKTSRISLGSFPAVSLAQARLTALENRQLLEKDIDPRKAKRPARRHLADAARSHRESANITVPVSAGTFGSLPRPAPDDKRSVDFLAYEYIESYVRPNREDPTYAIRILKKDVLPEWTGRDARTITVREVVELLDKIVGRGSPVMANRTADILGQMFKYGVHRAIVDDSPVKLLFRPGGKEKSGKRVLNESELIAFVTQLHKACRSKQKRHVLMLLLLTLQRRSELGLAEWKEFNFEEKVWRIPDHHAKNRRGHIVPLTDWAIAELEGLKEFAGSSRFVLPGSKKDRPANPKLITRSVARSLRRFEKIGVGPFKPHDLRRTGRTEMARLSVSKHIAERVLNHSKDVIEGTYDLYEYLDEKRSALNAWAQRLLQLRELGEHGSLGQKPAVRTRKTPRRIRHEMPTSL